MVVLRNIIALAGVVSITKGAWDLHPSAGYILGGMFVVVGAFLVTAGDMADASRTDS